ncbi:DUF11 domain-containing protein, partial [Clostridium botulinum]|nr:DUF11 domain-containing protein [Clostridium botulinum]
MAFINRYSKTDYIKLVHTGNTLGMGGSTPSSVTSFISLDTTLNAGTGIPISTNPNTFAGTTTDWQLNGSWASLNPSTDDVPVGSTVDFALLIWGTQTSAIVTTTIVDTTALNFGMPDGTTIPILADPIYSDNTGASGFVTRAREVTSFLKPLPNSAFGNYSVSIVPCRLPSTGVGWSLLVVYKNNNMPLRNISIFTGILNNGTSTTVSGFYTPATGTVKARAYAMALYGDSNLVGDRFTLNGTGLSGPRNPVNNFFPSQVCDYQGNLLLVSSYGDRNTNIGTAALLLRALFDITNVDASGILGNGVRSALLGIAGTTDVVSGNAAALEVNANAAQITLSKVVDKTISVPSDTLNYTIAIKNIGAEDATNVIFLDTIPSYTTFIPNSVTLNNISQPGSNPQDGINIGTLAKTIGVATVTFQVIVNTTIPIPTTIPNISNASYEFISDPSLPALSNLVSSNTVNTLVVEPTTSIDKYVDKTFSSINETLNYTIAIRNTSTNVSITNMILYDTIPTGTTFVTNSITKDGTPRPGEIVEPPT